MAPIIGFDAAAKAERVAGSIFKLVGGLMRSSNLGEPEVMEAQLFGVGDVLGNQANLRHRAAAREVVLRLTCEHANRAGAVLFMREQALINIGMVQGTAMPLGHALHPIVRLRSFLVDKREIPLAMILDDERHAVDVVSGQPFDPAALARPAEPPDPPHSSDDRTVPLIALAWGRSGDKGDLGLICIVARDREYLSYIGKALTAQSVAHFLAHVFSSGGTTRVDRYFSPGPSAFNFVLHGALGGGAIESHRLDPMAKSFAQQLLAFPVTVSREIAARVSDAASA